MRFTQALLGLAATVSAIDINLHAEKACRGALLISCRAAAPNKCCGRQDNFESLAFAYIPGNWKLDCRGHDGEFCNGLKNTETADSGGTKCLNNGPYTGGGYGFLGKRTAGFAGTGSDPAECLKPDTLVIEDGTEFNIRDMEDSLVTEFINIGRSGLNASSVPEKFLTFRK